jgi:hypothetical protein
MLKKTSVETVQWGKNDLKTVFISKFERDKDFTDKTW